MSDFNPIPDAWRPDMTDEEKKAYRKIKHRFHAARSRRLRGRDVPEGAANSERQSYPNAEHSHDPADPNLP